MRNLNIITSLIFSLFVSANLYAQQPDISFFRPYDQTGIHQFENLKSDDKGFDGVSVRVGGNFTQQFQALNHSNGADEMLNDDGVNVNQLVDLRPGFNLATANLNVDVQLEDGIRLNLVTYLSSRHHVESWVKGGYIQIDKLKFFNSDFIDNIMNYATIKAGHMEINYGDAHFRRTDNGNAIYNPFIGNYILDAFNTEIGAEIYYQRNGILAMAGITAGEIKGDVTQVTGPPTDDKQQRLPTILGKVGYDGNLADDVRLRVTGSVYYTASSARNFLYNGDRAGSRYYLAMENTLASTSSPFTSGRFNPVMMDQVTALMGNVFFKAKGFEFFGTYETATGMSNFETETRVVSQIAAEAIYRLGQKENFFLGARYNTVTGQPLGGGEDVSLNRYQIGLGWFITPNILLKGEYVNQDYNDFAPTDIRHEGNFNGFMVEASVGF